MEYDVVVLGGGAAGFSAALKLEEAGKKVALINSQEIGLGGTCINVGCVPSKHLLSMARLVWESKKQRYNSIKVSVDFAWEEVVEEKRRLIARLREEKYEKVIRASGVDLVEGKGKFVGEESLQVGKETLHFKNAVIATGSSPWIPPIKGLEEAGYLTNKEALELNRLPDSIAIIGGGAVGLEFAQMFSRFGSNVFVFLRGDRILKKEEPNLAAMLKEHLASEGITFIDNSSVKKVEATGGRKAVYYEQGGEERALEVDELLIATGRRPNTKDIGIEHLAITTDMKGFIVTDDYLKAGGNCWAAGDVVEGPMLETKAGREGFVAASNILGRRIERPKLWPHATFTWPELASVGLTDEEAKDLGCSCRTVGLELLPKAHIEGETKGAAKMVVEAKSHRILGVHVLSPRASDIVMEGALAVKKGMTLEEIIETLHIFPSFGEITKLAAQSFFRDVERLTCCAE